MSQTKNAEANSVVEFPHISGYNLLLTISQFIVMIGTHFSRRKGVNLLAYQKLNNIGVKGFIRKINLMDNSFRGH